MERAWHHLEHPPETPHRLDLLALPRGVVVTEAGSYLRPIDSCVTQRKAQGPSGTCNESKEEEEALTRPQRLLTGQAEVMPDPCG